MKKLFHFKQFSIDDSHCAMKVGTDSILLGSWVQSANPRHVLDVGAGSGLLGLMIAQRFSNAHITAIEIEEQAAKQCQENVNNALFRNSFTVLMADFMNHDFNKTFDLIISNPPYFTKGLRSCDSKRHQARNNEFMPLDGFLDKALNLLTHDGKLAFILPIDSLEFIARKLLESPFEIIRLCLVKSKPSHPEKLVMMEIGRGVTLSKKSIAIYTDSNEYSKEFIALTQAFYLSLK